MSAGSPEAWMARTGAPTFNKAAPRQPSSSVRRAAGRQRVWAREGGAAGDALLMANGLASQLSIPTTTSGTPSPVTSPSTTRPKLDPGTTTGHPDKDDPSGPKASRFSPATTTSSIPSLFRSPNAETALKPDNE